MGKGKERKLPPFLSSYRPPRDYSFNYYYVAGVPAEEKRGIRERWRSQKSTLRYKKLLQMF